MKKKSMTIKKPVFWKMFIKRFFIFAIVAVLIGVIGTKIASHFYGMYMASETEGVGGNLFNDLLWQYEATGAGEQFEKCVAYHASGYSGGNRIFIMVDNVTGEVVSKPSDDTLFLITYPGAEGEPQYPREEIYTCESAEIVNAIKESEAAAGCEQGTTYISMDDLYLKGYTFIPGKTYIMTYTDTEDAVIAELDFTPEDVTGYEHVTVGYDVEFAYEVPYYFDLALTPEVIQCMEETVANIDEWNMEMVSVNTSNEVGSPGYNTCYYATIMETGVELGEGYTLLGICHYNFFEEWMWECMISYISLIIATLALAVVTTNVSYMNQKNFYEMDQYRRDITNTMAHDLKSPLMVISGYAENLMEQDLTQKAQHFTKSIMENTEYMNRLIEKSLELSKVESGNYKLHKEDLNLREIAQELINGYMSQLEQRSLEIQMRGECVLNADKISMREVLDNLIGNAVKYAMEGSVIEIDLSDKACEVSNLSTIEFDMNIKDLMKPFVKGDNSRTGKKGSGIGLTIAKNLCEQQGYALDVDCKDGTFIAKVTW